MVYRVEVDQPNINRRQRRIKSCRAVKVAGTQQKVGDEESSGR
jgi:hypothetical protein